MQRGSKLLMPHYFMIRMIMYCLILLFIPWLFKEIRICFGDNWLDENWGSNQ